MRNNRATAARSGRCW